ncbi:MAG: hypothetical protein ACTHM9_04800 [Gemmatimonadales bacterium]
MNDPQWIQHLQEGMKTSGWTPVGPAPHGKGWIAGAVRFEEGSTGAHGPTGFGETPASAVEELYKEVVGDLPHRPADAFENEFEGIPLADQAELSDIRADFHRHGFELRWLHPMEQIWIMQWSPHVVPTTPVFGQSEEVGEYRGHDMTAIEAARHAWAKFQGSRGGG